MDVQQQALAAIAAVITLISLAIGGRALAYRRLRRTIAWTTLMPSPGTRCASPEEARAIDRGLATQLRRWPIKPARTIRYVHRTDDEGRHVTLLAGPTYAAKTVRSPALRRGCVDLAPGEVSLPTDPIPSTADPRHGAKARGIVRVFPVRIALDRETTTAPWQETLIDLAEAISPTPIASGADVALVIERRQPSGAERIAYARQWASRSNAATPQTARAAGFLVECGRILGGSRKNTAAKPRPAPKPSEPTADLRETAERLQARKGIQSGDELIAVSALILVRRRHAASAREDADAILATLARTNPAVSWRLTRRTRVPGWPRLAAGTTLRRLRLWHPPRTATVLPAPYLRPLLDHAPATTANPHVRTETPAADCPLPAHEPGRTIPLGYVKRKSEQVLVGIHPRDLTHGLIVAPTGEGKSSWLGGLCLSLPKHEGFTVVDAGGTFYSNHAPYAAALGQEWQHINLASPSAAVPAYNPLDVTNLSDVEREQHLESASIAIASALGWKMDTHARAIPLLRALIMAMGDVNARLVAHGAADTQGTLYSIPKMLQNDAYYDAVTRHLEPETLANLEAVLPSRRNADAAKVLTSVFTPLATQTLPHGAVLARSQSTWNPELALRGMRTVITVNPAQVGHEIVVQLILAGLLEAAKRHEENATHRVFYDEAKWGGEILARYFEESRKYRLYITTLNQSLARLPVRIRDAARVNAYLVAASSSRDGQTAENLAEVLHAPTTALQSLPKHTLLASVGTVDGPSKPFRLGLFTDEMLYPDIDLMPTLTARGGWRTDYVRRTDLNLVAAEANFLTALDRLSHVRTTYSE